MKKFFTILFIIFLLTTGNILPQRDPNSRIKERNPRKEKVRERAEQIIRPPQIPERKPTKKRKGNEIIYVYEPPCEPHEPEPIVIEENHYNYIYNDIDIDVTVNLPAFDESLLSLKERGILRLKEMKYYGAFSSFTLAIEEDLKDGILDDYDLLFLRGQVAIELKLYESAKRDYDLYIKTFFYKPEGYYQRGLALFYLNMKNEALEDFQAAADYGDKRAAAIIKRFYN